MPALFCFTSKILIMAMVKLGALVSNIRGSIGGITFRRTRYGISVYARQNFRSMANLLSNDALPTLAYLNQLYRELEESEREAWRALARTWTFPNAFGDQVNLTGRNLYQKCNGRLYHFGEFIANPTGLSNVCPPITISNFTILAGGECGFTLSAPAIPTRFIVQMVQLAFPDEEFNFTRQRVLFAQSLTAETTFDISEEFTARFPNVAPGQVYRLAITIVSEIGLSQLQPTVTTIVQS
jgi:hypothetical protein